MANEEKELFKFVNDPRYREKVIARIHKEKDNEYNRRIKQIESERDKLSKSRINEITRISNARWEKNFGGKLLVNRTEGKIRINNTENLFSSIQGAELNMMNGCRVVTTENTKSKAKKHGSLGGAVVGGMVAGPIGAVVAGSALGKTKTKTTGSTVSNQIPTCTHLGVLVNINGFVSEVVFISSQVDQSSMTFSKAQSEAQNFISQLGVLAKTPVPLSFLRPEEEVSVKAIDSQINVKQQELQDAIADRPVYVLPDMYRTEENREMSDDDYINYLVSTDAQRMTERAANEAAFKKEQAEKKAAEKAKRTEEKTVRRHSAAQKVAEANYWGKAKSIGRILGKIVFWILSIFLLLFAIVSFTTSGGILSGFLFLLTAVCVNPLMTGFIMNKWKRIPIWFLIIALIVGFLAGILTFPTGDENNLEITQNMDIDS